MAVGLNTIWALFGGEGEKKACLMDMPLNSMPPREHVTFTGFKGLWASFCFVPTESRVKTKELLKKRDFCLAVNVRQILVYQT